jgi:DNA invertase Pin-like site-specific DNA recombinase
VIVGYARVSTDQADQDLSIEAQVQQLLAAGCDRVIRERASAFKDGGRRPGWDELQALVASGHAREVVAISQSRLSRRGEDVQFLRICARRGVVVRFLDGTPGDISDPAARLMTGVMATVNEVDSQIKSINIKNGLDRRKAAGHYACAKVPYGYLYDGSQVVPHPEHWADARLLWDQMVAAEMNAVAVIRQHSRQWSAQGLYDWIEHPMLRGVISGKANAVEPLITWDEWRRAMEHRNRRRSGKGRAPRTIRLFSGMVRCQACGSWMHYGSLGRKHPRLKCTAVSCQWYSRGIAEWKVRAQAVEALRHASHGLGRVAASAAAPTINPEAAQWQQQLDQLRQLQSQGVPGLDRSIDELELKLMEPARPSGIEAGRLAALFAVPGALETATDVQLRAVLLEFVGEILYVGNPAEVEIRIRQGLQGDLA